jgi:hypothetical protein
VPRERDCAHREGQVSLGGASICSGNFSMLRMLVAADSFSRKILAPAVHGNITHLSGKRESWHHPSVLFSDNAWIECYRSSPSRARRHQARIRATAHMVIASCRALRWESRALPRIWWDKLPGCQLARPTTFICAGVGTVYPTLTFIVTAKTFVIPTYKVARRPGN